MTRRDERCDYGNVEQTTYRMAIVYYFMNAYALAKANYGLHTFQGEYICTICDLAEDNTPHTLRVYLAFRSIIDTGK